MAPSQELPPGFAIEIFLPMKRRRPCRASRVQDIKVAGTISICFDSMDVFLTYFDKRRYEKAAKQ